MNNCETCKDYWQLSDHHGECRNMPPLTDPGDRTGNWPKVLAIDGCGDHEPRITPSRYVTKNRNDVIDKLESGE